MVLIRIHSISKPDRWYKDLKGHIFTADLGLFGYWIRQGKHEGKLIYARDAGKISPSDEREGDSETFKLVKRINTRPKKMKPDNGAQKSTKLLREKHMPVSPEIERINLIEKQIKEYAMRKKQRRA